MARTKKQLKVKEPIKIRFKKLANGNQSIYLDIYYQGERTYEFLKMYIVPEVDNVSRTQNQNTLKCAEAIKAQRVQDLYNGDAGIKKNGFDKMLLQDFMKVYLEYKKKNNPKHKLSSCMSNTVVKLEEYNSTATLKDIDKAFCLGFIEHLKTARNKRQSRGEQVTISLSTARDYYKTFAGAMNWGVRKGYLQSNPCNLVEKEEKIKPQNSTREYLTKEEVQRLEKSNCVNEYVKQAFLFSCFCGLRISDVRSLTWGEVRQEEGKTTIQRVMVKTTKPIYLPLLGEGLQWLPARPEEAKPTDKVFTYLPSLQYMNIVLKQWAVGNDIDKNVTFHIARHTYATLLLEGGADIYTVKELLGHTDIKTTAIYAKIIDKTKEKAVEQLNNLFK